MAYSLDNRLVIGIASSALFDLSVSDAYFNAHGEDAYRKYQDEHIDDTLQPGVAFGFVRKLLALNALRPATDPLVEVIVLSRNDPATGLRVMRSIETHGLPISRAIFTQGEAPYEYMKVLSMSLFLSGQEKAVREAMASGFPAGLVLESASAAREDEMVRVALDFDGVVASDESERIFQSGGGLPAFHQNELDKRALPLEKGPLAEFLRDLTMIQDLERAHATETPDYRPRLRVSIVTARNAPAHERAVNTLKEWGITVNDAFFLGGIDKGAILQVMRPDIFFDDQKGHLESAARHAASVHIPYGVANERPSGQFVAADSPDAHDGTTADAAKKAVDE
jgi:5'-nucleotidase